MEMNITEEQLDTAQEYLARGWFPTIPILKEIVIAARQGLRLQIAPKASPRKHLVESAGYWFNSARTLQQEGKMEEALLAMENAYNHVENSLDAAKRVLMDMYIAMKCSPRGSKTYADACIALEAMCKDRAITKETIE